MEMSKLLWSTEDMDLRSFTEKYSRSLPMILLTTCGYMDVYNMNEVSADQIYWVYDVRCQRRVIAKTEDMRYVSIPLNYSHEFQRLKRGSESPGPAMRLEEMVGDDFPAGRRIKLAPGRSVLFDFSTDGVGQCNDQLTVLELQDLYTEKYLLAYTENEDEWESQVIGLPVYLPIRVKVATGLAGTDKAAAFQQWKQRQTKICASFGPQEFTPCKEILLFEEPPTGDYEFVNPCKYARSEAATESKDELSDVSDDDDSDGYENIEPLPPAKNRERVTTKPTAKPRPGNKQKSQASDNLIYEEVNVGPLPNRGVKPEGPVRKPRQDSGNLSTPSRTQQQADALYTPTPRATGKKQPPPTKPKTFQGKQVATSPSSAGADDRTAVCRVTPVKSSAGGDLPSSSRSSTSSEHGTKHWKSARDVPADLSKLSVEQVRECMELLHLPQLASAFRAHDVDGKLLVDIVSEELLITDFSCRVFDARKVVQFVKNGWRPNE